ncbi:hypothetical protein N658DRAFT_497840 [Parathielavia hyrcaniae]|uniref:Uncharacterized protein n=1 Tax=Parathielavia hyrcaniae TaxID=113614 RepID=A0AAN6Q056_9PEZI|nr:hypothetical protein N658DRAFT_497840 [Parathielavia hyrcaniae]
MAIATIQLPSAETVTAATTYLLRITQLCSLSISCYGVCYLIWLHNHHYCSYHYCGDTDRETASVPIGEVVYTVACVLAGLEWIYATSSTLVRLSQGKKIDSFTQLCGTWTSVVILAVGMGMFTSISTVRQSWPLCYSTGYIRFSVYYLPETNSCIVTQNAVTTGLIAMWVYPHIICVLGVRGDKGSLSGRQYMLVAVGHIGCCAGKEGYKGRTSTAAASRCSWRH